MASPFRPARSAALGARRDIVRLIEKVSPGDDILLAWPGPKAPAPLERETFRRRVHSAGYAVFGAGEYHCRMTEEGIVLRRGDWRDEGPIRPARARA